MSISLPRFPWSLFVKVAIMLGLLTSLASATSADEAQCEIINKPIDCSRLTHQECQLAKDEQHQRNLNIKQFCLVQAAQSGGGGGGAGSSGNGDGSGAGQGSQGDAANESANADTQGESSEGAENETAANQAGPFSRKTPITATQSGSSTGGDGPIWQAGALCDRFKVAYDAAKDENSRTQIREQAKQYNC